jgi:hypothetical protein
MNNQNMSIAAGGANGADREVRDADIRGAAASRTIVNRCVDVWLARADLHADCRDVPRLRLWPSIRLDLSEPVALNWALLPNVHVTSASPA